MNKIEKKFSKKKTLMRSPWEFLQDKRPSALVGLTTKTNRNIQH